MQPFSNPFSKHSFHAFNSFHDSPVTVLAFLALLPMIYSPHTHFNAIFLAFSDSRAFWAGGPFCIKEEFDFKSIKVTCFAAEKSGFTVSNI